MSLPLTSTNRQLLDFMVEIAEAANHLVQYEDGILRVVNRGRTAEPVATIRTPELLSLSVTPAYPIKRVYSQYEKTFIYEDTISIVSGTVEAEVTNLPFGEEQNYKALAETEEAVKSFLRNILVTESAFQCSADVFGVKDTWKIGDRIRLFEERLMIEAILTIHKIIFNFSEERTSIEGSSVLSFVKET